MNDQSVMLGGLLFTQQGTSERWDVLDLNYGMKVGIFVLEEGPGWILKDISSFIDLGHCSTLLEFAKIRGVP